MKLVHCPNCGAEVPNTDFRFNLEDQAGYDATKCPFCQVVSSSREWTRGTGRNITTTGQQADIGAW